MKVSDFMSRRVRVVEPDQTLEAAARAMLESDVGALPVCVGNEPCGMITDRDIAVRAIAIGKGPDTKVREIMSRDIKTCGEGENAMDVAMVMAQEQIRRLLVVDAKRKLVGIVSLADFATDQEPDISGVTLRGISQPGGAHCQSSEADRAA